jgi:fructose-1,6-bisphosphatase
MDNIIDLETVRSKRSKTEEEKAQKLIDQVHTAKTAIAMILGKLEVSLLEGSLAMQILVNQIIKDQEWDTKTFDKAVDKYKLIFINDNDDEELH